MHEQICKKCGYRRMERSVFDHIAQTPMYPHFMVNNVLPYMNPDLYESSNDRCPECGTYYEER